MAITTPKQVLEYAAEKKATYVDLKFMDFIGIWQHFSIPLYELTEDIFEAGLGFDGSSIRGWQGIEASDMILMPDASTAIPVRASTSSGGAEKAVKVPPKR